MHWPCYCTVHIYVVMNCCYNMWSFWVERIRAGTEPLHLATEHKKTTIYGVGKTGHRLGQAQICGGNKPVNGIATPF